MAAICAGNSETRIAKSRWLRERIALGEPRYGSGVRGLASRSGEPPKHGTDPDPRISLDAHNVYYG